MKFVCITGLVIAFAVPSLAHAKKHSHESDMVRIDNASAPAMQYALMRTSGAATGAAIDVYLNPNGATIRGGWENSARLSSGLVARRGFRSTTIPRYRGTRASFNAIVSCVKKRYAAFNVNIHTRRPSGRYIMAMIGGTSRHLGYSRGVGGVAPFNGRIIDNAIVFVFDRSWRRTSSICNTVVHEIGHALGLEHQYLCKDPMSYLRNCGTKTFQNVDAWCGEYRARRCYRGRTQNTYQKLARNVGLRRGDTREPDTHPDTDPDESEPEEPTIRPQPPARRPQPPIARRPPRDNSAPSLKILSARKSTSSYNGDTKLTIKVRAKDRGGIANVQLGWRSSRGRYVFVCGKIPRNMPVTCSKRGDYYTFTLRVGTGERTFALRAVDRAGNSIVSGTRSMSFGRRVQRRQPTWQPPRQQPPRQRQPQRPREPDYDDDDGYDYQDEHSKTGCNSHQ